MRDHIYEGVPVRQMTDEDILSCLRDGVQVIDPDGQSDSAAIEQVRSRLLIELLIRQLKN